MKGKKLFSQKDLKELINGLNSEMSKIERIVEEMNEVEERIIRKIYRRRKERKEYLKLLKKEVKNLNTMSKKSDVIKPNRVKNTLTKILILIKILKEKYMNNILEIEGKSNRQKENKTDEEVKL